MTLEQELAQARAEIKVQYCIDKIHEKVIAQMKAEIAALKVQLLQAQTEAQVWRGAFEFHTSSSSNTRPTP